MDEAWLNTVRIARDVGNISSLFPTGVTRLLDLPHTVFNAIRMALYFLSFENIPYEEDKPPKRIWLNAEKMDGWWKAVKARQEDRAKGNGSVHDMEKNALVAEMFPGVDFGGRA